MGMVRTVDRARVLIDHLAELQDPDTDGVSYTRYGLAMHKSRLLLAVNSGCSAIVSTIAAHPGRLCL